MNIYFILFCFLSVNFAKKKEEFTEELLIKSLKDNKIITHFQFTTQWFLNEQEEFFHYSLFPKSIGQLIKKFKIEELHLQFTQGRWLTELWGFPIISSPVGVELLTWFNVSNENNITLKKEVDNLFQRLTNTLSGVFCASMAQMKNTVTVQPSLSFDHLGIYNLWNQPTYKRLKNRNTLRYSILPREPVCTENLTPWMKLLPCRFRSGFGSLLKPTKLYDVHYHSMGIHIRKVCKHINCNFNESILELVQTLTIVFETTKNKNNYEWSFQSLFGQTNIISCPLAINSFLYIEKPINNYEIKLTPISENITKLSNDVELITYDLKKIEKPLSLTAFYQFNRTKKELQKSLLSTQRYVTGYGQENGGITVYIQNNDPSNNVTITYFEIIPWYLKLYFHTLYFQLNNQKYDPLKIFSSYNIVPSEDHSNPSIIEFSFTIPPLSFIKFSIQFEKAFLHFTEHPPDANRGFDIGSSIITFYLPFKNEGFSKFEWSPSLYNLQNITLLQPYYMYTDGILVTLPTPDFSMPYNVITLTGTVFALFYGSIFNILIRRMRHLDKIKGDFVSRRPLARLMRKIISFIEEN